MTDKELLDKMVDALMRIIQVHQYPGDLAADITWDSTRTLESKYRALFNRLGSIASDAYTLYEQEREIGEPAPEPVRKVGIRTGTRRPASIVITDEE